MSTATPPEVETTQVDPPLADPLKPVDGRAAAKLDDSEMEILLDYGDIETLADGEAAYMAGDAEVDLFVVKEGRLDVLNGTDDNRLIAYHGPKSFVGDIDILTRRPVIVSVIAHGPTTVVRVRGEKIRGLMSSVPKLGEKMLIAFQVRREMLSKTGIAGLRIIGHGHCQDTTLIKEFLYKNFVPFTWTDRDSAEGKVFMAQQPAGTKTPLVLGGKRLRLERPKLQQLAKEAGLWRDCPVGVFDLVIVGAGPSGMAAAVYAASEGLKTLVLDRLGPGGQAASSSKIENFIGFPAGLSGAELATRATLQMLKFGAQLITPVNVERLGPGPRGVPHKLHLDCGATIEAKSILLSTGVAWRKLDVPNAARYERAGIYYACTKIESRMHEGDDVAVVGAGNSAGQAAMFLSQNCARHVHVLVRRNKLGDSMSEYLTDRLQKTPNITVHFETQVLEVIGDHGIEAVCLQKKDGATSRLTCQAIFVFIGAVPHVKWLPEDLALDENGYILAGPDVVQANRWPLKDRAPCPLETSIPGIMAGGDVRTGTTKRVGFAVGDGSLAVTCAHRLQTEFEKGI